MWLTAPEYLNKINKDSIKYFDFNERILKITPESIPLDFSLIFGNDKPVKLEIGFGNGDSLTELAQRHPEFNFFGIDRKMDRVRTALSKLNKRKKIPNLLIARLGTEHIEEIFKPLSFIEIIMNFPDPWPKKRHNKNRTLNVEFLSVLHGLLDRGGCFRFASDHPEYSLEVSDLLSGSDLFCNCYDSPYLHSVTNRIETQFEKHKRKEGCDIYYIKYRKK